MYGPVDSGFEESFKPFLCRDIQMDAVSAKELVEGDYIIEPDHTVAKIERLTYHRDQNRNWYVIAYVCTDLKEHTYHYGLMFEEREIVKRVREL